MHFNFKISISLPAYGRPQRLLRAIDSIASQSFDGWELLLTGDCCPNFKNSDFLKAIEFVNRAIRDKGNKIKIDNFFKHTGFWGSEIRDWHKEIAQGEYFIFMGSDDILERDHLKNIVNFMDQNKELDWAYFDTWVEPYKAPRNAKLMQGHIGHSELIIKTDFLKKMPNHKKFYGHDWDLIKSMIAGTTKYKKAIGLPQTYKVMSVPKAEEKGID